MALGSSQSYVHYLFNHVDIRPENVHIANGTVPEAQVAALYQRYETTADGIRR